MKRWGMLILILDLFRLVAAATDFNNLPDNTTWCRFSSSWDTAQTSGYGDYMDSSLILMNPGKHLHPRALSQSGSSISGAWQDREPREGLPNWGYRTNNYTALGFIHTTDISGSNEVFTNLVLVMQAPTNLWNGTAFTNEGGWATSHVEWFSLGLQPNQAFDGSYGTYGVANDSSTNAAASMGYSWNDWWHPLITSWSNDFAGNQYVWSSDPGHPAPAGHVNMAIQAMKTFGVDTNVWSFSVNWDGSSAATNHCVASAISQTNNVLTFTLRLDRMMGGWDVPNGTITNDARHAFDIKPEDGNAFWEKLVIPTAPDGTFLVTVDGNSFFTTGSQLRNGYNFYTNYATAWWLQKVAVLGDLRDVRGIDRVTLLEHAGNTTGAHGLADLINFDGESQVLWNGGTRGNAMIAGMDAWETDLWTLDAFANADAQQTNHTLTVALVSPRFAPFHR